MYGRELDGEPVEFGTSGFTYNDTFVLYDRASGSIWYPMGDGHLTATSGALQGRRLPFVSQPKPQPLREWLAAHPRSLVLLPPEPGDWFEPASQPATSRPTP